MLSRLAVTTHSAPATQACETKARIDNPEGDRGTLGRRQLRSRIRIAGAGRGVASSPWRPWSTSPAPSSGSGSPVIVAGSLVTVWISFAAYRTSGSAAAYEAGRRSFGRALLASLEVFVAADLIRTVSVDLTLEGVGALGLLVVIRTILSFSIDIEISGALPCGPAPPKQQRQTAEPGPVAERSWFSGFEARRLATSEALGTRARLRSSSLSSLAGRRTGPKTAVFGPVGAEIVGNWAKPAPPM